MCFVPFFAQTAFFSGWLLTQKYLHFVLHGMTNVDFSQQNEAKLNILEGEM